MKSNKTLIVPKNSRGGNIPDFLNGDTTGFAKYIIYDAVYLCTRL